MAVWKIILALHKEEYLASCIPFGRPLDRNLTHQVHLTRTEMRQTDFWRTADAQLVDSPVDSFRRTIGGEFCPARRLMRYSA